MFIGSKIKLMYYFILDGEQLGPFEAEQIGRLNINRATLVWREGLSDWKEAHEVEELMEFLVSIPPPIPKEVSESSKVSTLNVNLGLKKDKSRKSGSSLINSEKIKVLFAKELKTNFKIAIFSLVGGIVAALVYGLYLYNESRSTYVELKNEYESKVAEHDALLHTLENYSFEAYAKAIGKESPAFVAKLNDQKRFYEVEEKRIEQINRIERAKHEKNEAKVDIKERLRRGLSLFKTVSRKVCK